MRSPTSMTSETVNNAVHAAVGTELLQQHSINSIIEQRQDFLTAAGRHNSDANSTLTNTIGPTIATSTDALSSALNDPLALAAEFLGLGSCTNSVTNTAAAFPSNILPLANVGGVVGDKKSCNVVGSGNAVVGGGGGGSGAVISHTNLDTLNTNNTNPNSLAAAYMPLTPSSTQSSISPGNVTNNPYDMFQFESIAPQHQQNTPLKVFQRNISFDCSAPLSPSTPSSLYNNSFQSSPLVSDSSNSSSANGLSLDSIPMVYQNGYTNGLTSTRSTSPESQNSNQSNENNLIDMMKFLNVGNNQQAKQTHIKQPQQQQQQQQQQYNFQNLQQQHQQQQQRQKQQETNKTANDFENTNNRSSPATNLFDEQNLENFEALSAFDMELTKLQALNAVTLLQAQQQQVPLLQNLLQTYNTINQLQNWQIQQQQQNHSLPQAPSYGNTNGSNTNGSDAYLDRVAKFYRGSAAFCEPTCTWSGQLPPRSHRLYHFSPKVFLGGIPWDVSEQALIQIFKPFGPVKVEWPGKEQQAAQPKGYVYIIFESDKQVKSLLSACAVQTDDFQNGGGIFFFKISSRRIKAKDVEVIPWLIGDSNYVKSTSQKLDPTKTVFVGALHGKLTAEALAQIMDDLFDGVLYAGLDTDKNKYPIGSGRVTFNNNRSYMKAVSAAFIEVRTPKFTKKLQIDPYLEDSLCSICGVQHGPYYCRELSCFRYFCFTCWQWQHSTDAVKHHQPLTRNSKSQTLVGIGPTSSNSSSLPSFNTRQVANSGVQQQNQLPNLQQPTQQQNQQQYQHLLSSLSQTQNLAKNSAHQPQHHHQQQQQHQSSLPQMQTMQNALHL